MTTVSIRVTVGGDAGKMADETENHELRTLDSLYYDYARIK
jgi:hypothetical protein